VQHTRNMQMQMQMPAPNAARSLPSQRQIHPDLAVDVRRGAPHWRTGGTGAGPPSRYAPRRPSTLRTSSTSNIVGLRIPASTVPRRINPLNNAIHADFEFEAPTWSSTPANRRNTASPTIRLAIPEESAYQLKAMSENLGNRDEKLRHNSGTDDNTFASQSFDESPVTSDMSSKMIAHKVAPLSMPSTGSYFPPHPEFTSAFNAQSQPASPPQNPAPITEQMISPTSNGPARSGSATPVLTTPTASNETSIDRIDSPPAIPAITDKNDSGGIVTIDKIAAFEAQCQILDQPSTQRTQGAPNRTVRFAELYHQQKAQQASFDQLRSMSQENLYSSQRPSSPSARSGSLASMARNLTLYEIIDAEQHTSTS
jgi:hypothetical protein